MDQDFEPPNQENPLCSKTGAAQAAIDVHNFATAISVLGAFIYQVQAQSAKKINAGYAALLIGWAADLIARL